MKNLKVIKKLYQICFFISGFVLRSLFKYYNITFVFQILLLIIVFVLLTAIEFKLENILEE